LPDDAQRFVVTLSDEHIHDAAGARRRLRVVPYSVLPIKITPLSG
jgi:hypothetical protein